MQQKPFSLIYQSEILAPESCEERGSSLNLFPQAFCQGLVFAHFSLKLANTEEYIDGALSGHLGEVLIRCNNVLYIRGVEEEEEDGEMRE
ncbi:small nuclear ribonucleoprotein F [Manacus vitellinus]|uniref:small nuclear ribonucleoprotein F n=1 Tax=Manacus vitellinus TaxID=328815 RepID=UPI00115E2BF9|nr:small nuclear ribonucleoprotein F [Manacus vitellinus]